MAQLYKRPPITEAVIEFRVEDALSRKVVDQIKDRFLVDYPAPPQQAVLVNVQIENEAATAKLQRKFNAYKLTSGDGTAVVSLGSQVIATSRFAPYPGWEPFVAEAKRNWDKWKGIAGYRKVTRIGVRYINRIDVPNPKGDPITFSDYLRFFPTVPDFGQLPMESFAINTSAPLQADDCMLILNASTAPSPLVKAVSFILDIDVSKSANVPQNEDAIWKFVNQVRELKNRIFEASISDQARRLFE